MLLEKSRGILSGLWNACQCRGIRVPARGSGAAGGPESGNGRGQPPPFSRSRRCWAPPSNDGAGSPAPAGTPPSRSRSGTSGSRR